MNYSFAQVPSVNIPRGSFDLTHNIKTTFDFGKIIPFYTEEIYPGDTFNVKTALFGRLATPIHPIMDNMFLDIFFFFVPNRLVWDNWQKFMGERKNPDDTIDFLIPQMVATAVTGYGELSLSDYLGLPTKIPGYSHSSLYYRAYNLIWNEWFRDQNLQDSVVVDTDDGPDSPSDYQVLIRNKRHDYFTSCLPWPQKGEAVTLPLGDFAPIVLNMSNVGTPNLVRQASNYTSTFGAGDITNNASSQVINTNGSTLSVIDPNGAWITDLADATASTVNQLRQAFQVQRILERDARAGTRYTEILRSQFGVISPDARLQRPEYLGGGSTIINLHAIAQTSSTDATTPQGNLSAFGTMSITGKGFVKSFVEHGMVIGLCSARGQLSYQQGLERKFSRLTRYDFYQPALAHLGEQAVLNKEIYTQGTSVDEDVFGYQERWAELRFRHNQITGLFRSNATQSLDTWHIAQEFGSLPLLNEEFIQENPAIDRAIAVPSQPHIILDGHLKIRAARPLPLYGVPGLIDHF